MAKASSRIGYLRIKIPIRDLPLSTVLCLFDTYILPILTYGLHLWLPNICSSSEKKLNSLFTKFLKYYLGIPYSAINSITHYMTNTIPLSHLLRQLQDKSLLSVKVPSSLSGFKLHSSFILNSNFHSSISDLFPIIPSWFWYSRPVHSLPTNKFSRRATCYDSFDLFHSHLCVTKTYHSCPTDTCICSYCSAPASHYHHRSCPTLHPLSPPQLLSLLTIHYIIEMEDRLTIPMIQSDEDGSATDILQAYDYCRDEVEQYRHYACRRDKAFLHL
ncbi:hypothetical protein GQR58_008860 [Nymphon striatum]|nr:hypothetical protein GQR58_008860 [Nymphon striatum]